MIRQAKAGDQMTGKIFLSYRRMGTAEGFAHALFHLLKGSFPAESLFMDVEGGIRAGQNFVRVLEQEVSACDAMLVVIGPDWLTAADEQGRRRLENPADWVRIEVGSALQLAKRVIPVLVQRAEMPRVDELPEPLKELAWTHAVGLRPDRFNADAQGLIKVLEDALAEVKEARSRAATEAEAAEKRRAAEEAAKADEVARAEKEDARLKAIAGLSPDQIAKAEELVNWNFIKDGKSSDEFRDHLARFPQGVTVRTARARLEELVWGGLPRPVDAAALPRRADIEALKGFLGEFPNGAYAREANAKLAKLEAAELNTQNIEFKRFRAEATAALAAELTAKDEELKRFRAQPSAAQGPELTAKDAELKGFRGKPSAALKLSDAQPSYSNFLRIASTSSIISVAPFAAMLAFMYFYWAYLYKGIHADPNNFMPGMWYLSAYQLIYGVIFAWITVRNKNISALWRAFYLPNVIIVWIAMGFFKFDAWFVMYNFLFSLISATLCANYVKSWRKKLMA
jgi:TIR domain-containing protein